MEEKVVAFLSSFSMLLMGICLIVLMRFPNFHATALALSEQAGQSGRSVSGSVLSMLKDDSSLLKTSQDYIELQQHQIRLEIPTSVDMDQISVSEKYMSKEILLSIPGVGDTYFYDYPMIGKTEGISDMRYEVYDHVGMIDISTNHIFEPEITQSGNYLYLDFKRPKKIYDYLVAIDAGHGAEDPGAVQGDVYEKDINLGIVRQLKKLFDKDKHNIGVYYTRLKDTNPDFPDRVELTNDLKTDAFVSVHINSTDSGRLSGISGASVMYMVTDKTGESKELAGYILDHMLFEMGSASKGLVPGDELYVLRMTDGPSVLCECGFLTNPEEQALLRTKEYQRKIAMGIYLGILQKLGIED